MKAVQSIFFGPGALFRLRFLMASLSSSNSQADSVMFSPVGKCVYRSHNLPAILRGILPRRGWEIHFWDIVACTVFRFSTFGHTHSSSEDSLCLSSCIFVHLQTLAVLSCTGFVLYGFLKFASTVVSAWLRHQAWASASLLVFVCRANKMVVILYLFITR